MKAPQDAFLSEEDLDFRNMTDEELLAHWDAWLLQAQATNDQDQDTYTHGVFVTLSERRPAKGGAAVGGGARPLDERGEQRHRGVQRGR